MKTFVLKCLSVEKKKKKSNTTKGSLAAMVLTKSNELDNKLAKFKV